jgi:hypothetical protein
MAKRKSIEVDQGVDTRRSKDRSRRKDVSACVDKEEGELTASLKTSFPSFKSCNLLKDDSRIYCFSKATVRVLNPSYFVSIALSRFSTFHARDGEPLTRIRKSWPLLISRIFDLMVGLRAFNSLNFASDGLARIFEDILMRVYC